jgi:hypothetical protein
VCRACTACEPDPGLCPLLRVGSAEAFPEGQVQVPVALESRGQRVAALNFTAEHRAAFSGEFLMFEACALGPVAEAVGAELTCAPEEPPGEVTVALINRPVVPVPVLGDGTIAYLVFDVASAAAGQRLEVCIDPASVRLGSPEGPDLCAAPPVCGRVDVRVPGCLQGDCNCDGRVNSGDRVCLVTKFFEESLQGTCDCEDCNGSGEMNAADAPCITRCAFGQCPPTGPQP